jgi:uncharacterized membrane protein
MNQKPNHQRACEICEKSFSARETVPLAAVREPVVKEIQKDHAGLGLGSYICKADLNKYRGKYVHSLLESEKGELTTLEEDVVESLRNHEVLAKNVEADVGTHWTFGERLADKIATFGGSWAFLICFGAFIAVWIGVNSFAVIANPADPYPFILLNLVLSCLAAIQAPVIMMSQRRQEAKDRVRSQHDYQVNLKAELEIRHLHDKIDHLLSHQWDRLVAIQEVQLELLAEISKRK